MRRTNILHKKGQTFSVVGGSGHYDVDEEEEEDVSKANILSIEAIKLIAGARILRVLKAESRKRSILPTNQIPKF